MRTTRPERLELFALAAILALAALLRMGWPGITEFKGDEARLAGLALDLAEGKSLPLRGLGSSIGLPNSPLSVYLYALPLFFWSTPLSATLFTGALNVLAVALCWWVGRRYWGTTMALCAALLFATSPWAVIFSRKIWAQNLLPPFTLAYAATGLQAFVEQRRWPLAAHLVLLAVVVQIHYSGLALVPLTVLLLILFRKRVDWRALVAGIGLAGLTGTPFAYHLLTHGSGEWQTLAHLLSRPASVDWQSLRFWWMTTAGSDVHSLAGSPAYQDFLRSVPNLDPVRWLVGALTVGGIGFWLWAALQRQPPELIEGRGEASAEAGGIVALWALAPLAFFWRHTTPVFPHYYIVAFAAQYLAAGFVLACAISSGRPALRWGAVVGTLGIVTAQAGIMLALLNFLAAHTTPGGFGIPLKFQLQAAERARALGTPVVVVSPGDDPSTREWPAVFDVLLSGTSHRFVDGAHAAIFTGTPATLLIAPGAGPAVEVYSLAGILDPAGEIPARPGDEPFRVARLKGGPPFDLSPATEPRTLSNGVGVTGYRLNGDIEPGQPLEWWIAWRVVKPPPDPAADYHIFNHLVDAGGERWTQADGPTVPAKDWVVGDFVVQVFRLEVPPEAGLGPFWMRVGMYTYPALENQLVVDEAGSPISDAVTLGPLAEP